MVFFNLHPLPCILIAVVILASQFTEQVSYLNPHILPTVVKSIRGFEFNRYFDFVANPYTRASVDGAGKKTVVLQGVNVKWVFDLEVNKDLFSPLYQYYDTNFQPQTSNLRDCYYHGKVRDYPNSFLALSDCEGLHGMVILDDDYKHSIHTLLNSSIMIMRENLPYAENRNPQYIIVRPTKKEVLPQKYEEETATKVEVSSTEKGDGNIGRKHEAVTSDTTPFINEENPYMIENNMNTHLKPDINEKREPIVSPPLVQIQSNPRLQTIEQPRSHNERGITQRNGVQPGATNSKKNEQMKSQTNSPSRDTLKNEALLKERRNAIKATWISARQTDLDKLGLGLPAKFSAASATSKPDTTRNLKKRQMGNKRFYDIAFTLGRMAEITNPRHAEQYIADVVNMLQWYYKKFYFNGFSVRLSGAHYLLQHKTLIDFQDLPKNNTNDFYLLDWNKLANKLPFQTSDQKFLFTREFKEFPLSMKGIAYKGGIGCNEKLRTGIVLISDGYVTNFYEIVRILVHEIGHVTGMAHEDEDGCGNEGKAMENKNNPFHPWKGFSRCSLEKLVCKP